MTEPKTILELGPIKFIQFPGRPDMIRLETCGLASSDSGVRLPSGEAVCDLSEHEVQQIADHLCAWIRERSQKSEPEHLLNCSILLEKGAIELRGRCRRRSGPWHYVGDLLDEVVSRLSFVQSFARVAFHHDRYKAMAEGQAGVTPLRDQVSDWLSENDDDVPRTAALELEALLACAPEEKPEARPDEALDVARLLASAVTCEDPSSFFQGLIDKAREAGYTDDGRTLTEAGKAAVSAA